MRARWVSNYPEPKLPMVGQAIVAGWWPWSYYWVSTIAMDWDSPLGKLTRSLETGNYYQESLPEQYLTQVFRCDRSGSVKNMRIIYYEREYSSLNDAKLGHESTIAQLAEGKLALKRHVLAEPCCPDFWLR